jgi:hypothetical protein
MRVCFAAENEENAESAGFSLGFMREAGSPALARTAGCGSREKKRSACHGKVLFDIVVADDLGDHIIGMLTNILMLPAARFVSRGDQRSAIRAGARGPAPHALPNIYPN